MNVKITSRKGSNMPRYEYHTWDAKVDHIPINLYTMWSFTGDSHDNIKELEPIRQTDKINPQVKQLLEGIKYGKSTKTR